MSITTFKEEFQKLHQSALKSNLESVRVAHLVNKGLRKLESQAEANKLMADVYISDGGLSICKEVQKLIKSHLDSNLIVPGR